MEDDIIIKLLSEDPSNYDDAPLEGIRRILSKFTGKEVPRGEPLDTSKIESIRMGTTVATNALLERKGERIALVVTKGFKDCLEIGNQSRPKIFDLAIKKPEVLYEKVIEIDERVTLEDYAEDPERHVTKIDDSNAEEGIVRGLSGEAVRILKRPSKDTIKLQLQKLYDDHFRSIAVCLVHGYTFTDHEAMVGQVAKEIGFEHVSLSHELMPMIKLVPRTTSACADAYLTPAIKKYIAGFQAGFEGGLGTESVKKEKGAKGARCEFMQSDGGLVDVGLFSGLRAILSGPAGGVVGYALTSYDPNTKTPVIGFDMGGTSTDVSRYGSGRYEHVFETTTAGVTIQSPQLDINTVAAGGGSRLFFRNGLFVVGPESAGAHPGPACYRKGGPLTVTDANLFLGRLLPDFFPKIFGKTEDQGLDETASEKLFKQLTEDINKEIASNDKEKEMNPDEVAYGFIKIANETMTRPIRSLTEAKGHDTSQHRLATFGGAGGQHAVAIAESLGIKQILVHRYSSVLSAYGMALADVVDESQVPDSKTWSDEGEVVDELKKTMHDLEEKSTAKLRDQGFSDDSIVFEEYLNMRYRGTESALMIIKPSEEEAKKNFAGNDWAFGKAFVKQHEQEFGFTLPDRDIIVDDVRARGIGKSFEGLERTVDMQLKDIKPRDLGEGKRYGVSKVYFEGGRQETPIYKLEDLDIGDRVQGPAILADGTQTIVITPGATALVIETHVVIDIGKTEGQDSKVNAREVDPIMLSIFAHRFMAIAEQMGRALQKTSVSTNVKERLDYSCALFDSTGGLVANGRASLQSNITILYLTHCSTSSASPPRKHVNMCHHPSGNMERQAETRRRHRVQPPRVWRYSSPRYHSRHSSFQWRGHHLLRCISCPSCGHWRNPTRFNAAPLSRTIPRRSGHKVRKACLRRQIQRKKNHRAPLRRASTIPRMQWHTLPSRQPQRSQSPNRRQPKRHQPDQRTNFRLRRSRRPILYAQHPRQRRAQRPQPPEIHQPTLLRARPNRHRPHGRRQPHHTQNNHRPDLRRSCLRLRRHGPRSLRQHERPRSRHLLRHHLHPAQPDHRRHPSKPRLPGPDPGSDPAEILPLPLRRRRRRRRQRPHIPTRHRRDPARLLRLRRLPRRLQQPDLRLRRQRLLYILILTHTNKRIWLLRNHSRRLRRGTDLGRHERRAHAHDEHAHHGRRGLRTALPGAASRIQPAHRQCRGGATPRRGRRDTGHRIPPPGSSEHFERTPRFPPVWNGRGRGSGVRD